MLVYPLLKIYELKIKIIKIIYIIFNLIIMFLELCFSLLLVLGSCWPLLLRFILNLLPGVLVCNLDMKSPLEIRNVQVAFRVDNFLYKILLIEISSFHIWLDLRKFKIRYTFEGFNTYWELK